MKSKGKNCIRRLCAIVICFAMTFAISGCKEESEKKPNNSSSLTSSTASDTSSNTDSSDNTIPTDKVNTSPADNISSTQNVSSILSGLTTTLRRPDTPSKVTNDEVFVAPEHKEPPFKDTVTVNGHTYKLVWNDEFNGDSIDYNKWGYGNVNNSSDSRLINVTQEQDSSIVGVRDGQLQLNARRYFDPSNKAVEFATNKSVETQKTMNFRYGYVEMYAKVPHKLGCFPAFWAMGASGLVTRQNTDYYVEIDIFENVGGKYIDTNVHKWYTGPGLGNVSSVFQVVGADTWVGPLSKHSRIALTSTDNKTLPYEYHKYAMEWTPEYLTTYFDNTVISTVDLSGAWDQNWERPNGIGKDDPSKTLHPELKKDMSGFHDYIFLLIQNLIKLDSTDPQQVVNDNSEFPYEYWIDYVRLYQDPTLNRSGAEDEPNKNGLIYLDENGNKVDYYAK